MGKTTNISWATSTFNPWIGCTKVAPPCDNCYAEVYNRRVGHDNWGAGKPRRLTGPANWSQPLKWNAEAERTGKPWRVFCASLADVFDNEVPDDWRRQLFDLIRRTRSLTWMLLTKRIGNARRMLPDDWAHGWPHVWIGATVGDQGELDRDRPKLLEVPAVIRFLSVEPMLGPIHLSRCPECGGSGSVRVEGGGAACTMCYEETYGGTGRLAYGDWVIVGGESGARARPIKAGWVRAIRRQCLEDNVPFFFKQWGEYAPGFNDGTYAMDDPDCMRRVGTALAGSMLDGKEFKQWPR